MNDSEVEYPHFDVEWMEARYENLCSLNPSGAITEHLPLLRSLAAQCASVVEFGTWHCHSANALVLGTKGVVTSFDHMIWAPEIIQPIISEFCEHSRGKFIFKPQTTLQEGLFGECDLLFLDSKHSYINVKYELEVYGMCSRKYLVFHDTVTFGEVGDDGKKGILSAIYEFMAQHTCWRVVMDELNNNGLLVLKRTN